MAATVHPRLVSNCPFLPVLEPNGNDSTSQHEQPPKPQPAPATFTAECGAYNRITNRQPSETLTGISLLILELLLKHGNIKQALPVSVASGALGLHGGARCHRDQLMWHSVARYRSKASHLTAAWRMFAAPPTESRIYIVYYIFQFVPLKNRKTLPYCVWPKAFRLLTKG